MRSAVREGETFEGRSLFVRLANLVKLPHTVFALPFAMVGVVLASRETTVRPAMLIWVILAFTGARFAAMAFNRIVDRRMDALNPRTAAREIPSGALTVAQATLSVIAASLIFFFAAAMLNPLCLALAPVALAVILFYSYTKRFTRWSHLVLGAGLGIAPAGGYIAVTGSWSEPWTLLPALALAVTTWVGGFDILYALQDLEFDRREGLHSIPAKLGERGAIFVSRVLHVLAVSFLALAGVLAGGGVLFFLGVATVAALLVYEHSLVRPGDLSRLNTAFFNMNGIISIVFFTFVFIERILS